MTSLDQLKLTFFDECGEAMQDIETGLTELREGGASDDTVNAVFRAVHSVKGGAGIFGFEALVRFAHVFETVLDSVRHGTLSSGPETVDVLLTASDVLTDLVTMSRAGEAIAEDFGGDCRAALERLIGADEEGVSADGDFDIDFVPLRADGFDAPDDGPRTYAVTFRPRPELLRHANEPLYLIRELRKLGELDLVAETDALPPLAEIVPDVPYIGWTGTLRTCAPRSAIEEVFEFVSNDCELIIDDLAPATGSGDDLLPELVNAAGPIESEPRGAPDGEGVVGAAVSDPANAQPAATTTTSKTANSKPAVTTARVELEKIDRVVNVVGELVIAQAMLGQIVQELPEQVAGRLSQILDQVVHHTRELKDSAMSMRAQPVGSVFQRMPRLVRELAAKTGKKVRLETFGEHTEVDRSLIERLSDPLTHIIRNSVDHGIEPPADRIAAGKSEEGIVRLAAEHRGGRIVIEIKDDGAGVNSERVLKKAREKGLVGPDTVLSEDEINNLIMLPGFSTAEKISDISGRGVGMDVVKSNIQDIGGRISLKSERGRGMTIQLALPLTLAVMDGMVIKVGRETYVIPLSVIVECLRPSRAEIKGLVGTAGMLKLRGDLVPIAYLADLLEVQCEPGDSAGNVVVIITEAGDGSRMGIVVDELCGHQQVVIKSIEESYGTVPGIAAATILGNGRVAFILDVEKFHDLAVGGVQPGGKSMVGGPRLTAAA
jgi:two-component system, chemotaxis family, sensor kinase CheA